MLKPKPCIKNLMAPILALSATMALFCQLPVCFAQETASSIDPHSVEIVDFVVRAGVGIGPLKLGSSPDDVRAILASPTKIIQRGAGVVEHVWWSEDLGEIHIVFADAKAVQILVTSSLFRTPSNMRSGDAPIVFISLFSPKDDDLLAYEEKNQNGFERPTLYGKTSKGIAVRMTGPSTNNISISALIVTKPNAPIYPQFGAVLHKRKIQASTSESNGTHLSIAKVSSLPPAKPPSSKLSARQYATAMQVYKELDILQKQLAATRNWRRVKILAAQGRSATQRRIKTLPLGEPRKSFQLVLEQADFYVLTFRGFENVPESQLWAMESAGLGTTPIAQLMAEIRGHLNQAKSSLTKK